ncbi:hypothetical protein [uncultured Shewanella sp.]|uniref:hypothetical protein n=1 Tax=uncultured Shewanella sp. TaxID=173975 RepID=UPI002628BCF6|nr:hypothetical protein [uncultured Shewanella sp.]
MYFSKKLISSFIRIIYINIISLGMLNIYPAYAVDTDVSNQLKHQSKLATLSEEKPLIKGISIEGRYHCTNMQGGHLRKLKIIEDEKISPTEEGFYSFTLYLTAGNKHVYSNSTGYMIFDTKRQTASGYMRNQVDSQIEGVGILYFKLSNKNQVTFEAYFIDKSENRVGSNLCTKQIDKHIHQPMNKS